MSDERKIMFELLQEVREDQKNHGVELAKVGTILIGLDGDVKQLTKDVGSNTKDLAHHIRRTDELQNLNVTNKNDIELLQGRVEKLELPGKAKGWLRENLVSIISILTAIGSIIALLIQMR